jgi:hypothetical protein
LELGAMSMMDVAHIIPWFSKSMGKGDMEITFSWHRTQGYWRMKRA